MTTRPGILDPRLNPAHSQIFIVSPLRGAGLARLLASHPPAQERIRRLQEKACGPQ